MRYCLGKVYENYYSNIQAYVPLEPWERLQCLCKFCPMPRHLLCMTYSEGEGLRAVEDVLKPPGSLLATDRSKAVVLV